MTMGTNNLLQRRSIGQIPFHDGHVTAATKQTRSVQTQRLDAIGVIWLQAAAWADDAGTVRRYLEHLQQHNYMVYSDRI